MIKLYHGKNSFLSYRQAQKDLKELRAQYMKQDSEVERSIIDATTVESEAIINEIETPSLFSHQKLILIKRLSENKDKNELRDFFIKLKDQDIPEDIIIWETQKVRGNTNYFKSFENVYESPELNKRTFITWAKKQLNKKDLKLTNDALYLLANRTNYDPERFLQELDKIKLSGKSKIDKDLITALCPDTLEHTVWELIDNINEGNSRKAASQLQALIDQGNDAYFVLVMLARNIRLIFLTKRLKEKSAGIKEIASKTHTPPFAVKKLLNAARKSSYKQIKLFYQKLCNIDYAGKTGQLDVKLALDILLCVI